MVLRPDACQEETMPLSSELDLRTPSGRLHVQRFGAADAPLVLCLPGLSANLRAFDFLGERIGGADRQVVAVDLRGRGRSSVTGPGTYGWENHARDALAVAGQLGAESFSVIGQSMGAFVAMRMAAIDHARLERLVLIDACGAPDPQALGPIAGAVERLGTVFSSVEAYLDRARSLGTIRPWSEYWERYFRYELEPVEGGVRSRSDPDAVREDSRYGQQHSPYELWSSLTMPVLLLRASQELLPGLGRIVSDTDRERFPREVASARVVEVDANHYGINTVEPSARAIREFLDQPAE
jgi:pimeloyl-ACP methyl ester carboxylesterase